MDTTTTTNEEKTFEILKEEFTELEVQGHNKIVRVRVKSDNPLGAEFVWIEKKPKELIQTGDFVSNWSYGDGPQQEPVYCAKEPTFRK